MRKGANLNYGEKQKLELTWIGKENRPKLEPKASNQMEDATVLVKKEAAIKWCKNASDYAAANGGKPGRYVLIRIPRLR